MTAQDATEAQPARVAQGTAPFRIVRTCDGTSGTGCAPRDVLLRGIRIERVAAALAPDPGTRMIDGARRVPMPSLIDVHRHNMLATDSLSALLNGGPRYLSLVAGALAGRTRVRGFTTVLDFEGDTVIADGPAEVRLRARTAPARRFADRLSAGGGVSSAHRPLDVITFTGPQLHEAVQAAASRGTGVTVHVDTTEAIRRAIDAGVKVSEHGRLMDEDTARPIARQGAILRRLTRCCAPAEALVKAAGTNRERLTRSGKRSPGPGEPGVVREGASRIRCASTAPRPRT